MIRIELGSHGLSRIRFAISPLNTTEDLLFTLGRFPHVLDSPWRARAVAALRDRRLGLLAVIAGGGPGGYAPDFPRPEPAGFQPTVDAELHQVATTSLERIRYELTAAVNGHSWNRARKPPTLLLAAMERGEDSIRACIADQLEQFWQHVLAPDWPRIRGRLEGDITARSAAIAHHGLRQMINQLAPNLAWRDGGLDLAPSTHQIRIEADATILVPSTFVTKAIFCAGEPAGTPAPRTPLIVYPAIPDSRAPLSRADQLIGATRAQLLAELAQPHTTAELAERLHLSPATVSYHLQILHRAGLLQRTRQARNVLYQHLLNTA
ncbi:ArsR/SmtB family transcription factor [Streptomyces mirabilis]|uniref:ArsR/SmtB family transcription factor n=1 Tax=Streptomyces mirabilis TaxID=68239 RepID=UPI0036C49F61